MADIGMAQIRAGSAEKTLVTSGDDVAEVARFLQGDALSYTAGEVIQRLLGSTSAAGMAAPP